jgi:peptide methionine sulfoxide reductase msrA/msrB
MTNTPDTRKAWLAGGCFWGVEYHLRRIPGVLDVVSGFMGGTLEHPTYRQVCTQHTGHVETVEVTYDPQSTDFETIARRFFEIHDPTQVDRQGPDIGIQYRSVVFYADQEQHRAAAALIAELMNNNYEVVTELSPASTFWPAGEEHQVYYDRHLKVPSCHFPVPRFQK